MDHNIMTTNITKNTPQLLPGVPVRSDPVGRNPVFSSHQDRETGLPKEINDALIRALELSPILITILSDLRKIRNPEIIERFRILHQYSHDPIAQKILKLPFERQKQILNALNDFYKNPHLHSKLYNNRGVPYEPSDRKLTNTFPASDFNYRAGIHDVPVILNLRHILESIEDKDTVFHQTFTKHDLDTLEVKDHQFDFKTSVEKNLTSLIQELLSKNNQTYLTTDFLDGKSIKTTIDNTMFHDIALLVDFKMKDPDSQRISVNITIADSVLKDQKKKIELYKTIRPILQGIISKYSDNGNIDIEFPEPNIQFTAIQTGPHCTTHSAKALTDKELSYAKTLENHMDELTWFISQMTYFENMKNASPFLQSFEIGMGYDPIRFIKQTVRADLLTLQKTSPINHHYGPFPQSEKYGKLPTPISGQATFTWCEDKCETALHHHDHFRYLALTKKDHPVTAAPVPVLKTQTSLDELD